MSGTEEAGLEGIQNVNLSRQEVIDRMKEDLNFFAALMMPSVFTVMFPPVYHALWKLLRDEANVDKVFRLLLALPRGHAKTTFIKLFAVYLILFTNRAFILIICASQPKAENFMADIEDMLSEDNTKALFGDWKRDIEKDVQNLKKFYFLGRDIIVAATGQGSVRGLNIKNRRPDVIIMDDVQDKENAESATESHKLLNWIQSTVMKLRDPRRCFFIYIGNKYKVAPDCVCVLERLEKNPMWTHIVTGAILADGEPLWPELHSKEALMEEFENDFNMGTPEIFLSEVMNDTEANLNALVDFSKVPFNPYELPEDKVLCQGRFVIIDVAPNKIGGDDTAIALHALYPAAGENKKAVLEKIKTGSLSPKDTIREALKFCFEDGANVVAVEDTGYQGTFIYWFDEVCKELGIEGIHLVSVTPIGKKSGRILNYLKQLLRGDCYLSQQECLVPDIKNKGQFISKTVRSIVQDEALSYKPAKQINKDNVLDSGAYWQQVVEKYEHLIALPIAMVNSEWQNSKVIEDAFPF